MQDFHHNVQVCSYSFPPQVFDRPLANPCIPTACITQLNSCCPPRLDDMAIPDEQTEVIICGGGPTGALLSALLGQMHVPNIVLEKEADITTDPRGIALDEDGIRILQSIGVYDRVYTEIGSCEFHWILTSPSD